MRPTRSLDTPTTPARVRVVSRELGLNRSFVAQYWSWIRGLISGNPGHSYVNGESVWSLVGPRVLNTGVLLALSAVVGIGLGLMLGLLSAVWRNGWIRSCRISCRIGSGSCA